MDVIHMSDLHFAPDPSTTLSPDSALAHAADALKKDFRDNPLVLLISGDITTKARPQGYSLALSSIRTHLLSRLNITQTLVCPGNHEVNRDASDPRAFQEFNRFAHSLTSDARQTWTSTQPVCRVDIGEDTFLLVNSAYHGESNHGEVPLTALRTSLMSLAPKSAIVVVHHSPISSLYGGGSLADSYELLTSVADANATALLHGHVHSDQALRIGSSTYMYGVGSLGFAPDPNMNNQFAVHKIEGGAVTSKTYRYYANINKFV